ncbi:hypothetical protein E2C01_061472 [Portunus trituberculatus]|uniref:Uncharacterized protein n=1 Tax=Portunus trituberculatus TaxID=210409 RepID=A0A5B7HBR1_PORTR|nr:hypothetical protein [Portunus trituberculatus]
MAALRADLSTWNNGRGQAVSEASGNTASEEERDGRKDDEKKQNKVKEEEVNR